MSSTRAAQDASSADRRARPKVPAVLGPEDSISNFGDSGSRTMPRSTRPPARTVKSHGKDDESVACRTYLSVDGSLRQPNDASTKSVPRHDDSVPSVLRTSASEDDLRAKRDRPSSKTAAPTSSSLGHSSRRVATASSVASSGTSISGLAPLTSAFPGTPQFDAAAVTKIILENVRIWLPQLGMANLDTDQLFKKKRQDILKNGVSEELANQLALIAVMDLMGEAVANVEEASKRRMVPPSPRSSSLPKSAQAPRATRK